MMSDWIGKVIVIFLAGILILITMTSVNTPDWEYKKTWIEIPEGAGLSDTCPVVEAKLNEFGSEGWELIQMKCLYFYCEALMKRERVFWRGE